jgi:hypothetical protein
VIGTCAVLTAAHHATANGAAPAVHGEGTQKALVAAEDGSEVLDHIHSRSLHTSLSCLQRILFLGFDIETRRRLRYTILDIDSHTATAEEIL